MPLRRTSVLCLICALLPVAAAGAEPRSDPHSIWTMQDENDVAVRTDRFYTNGTRIGWTSPTDLLPGFLSELGRTVWGEGTQRLSVNLSQLLFTPVDTQINPPNPFDRPYAGVLVGSLALIQDTETTRSVLGLDLGVIGPAAGGKFVQNTFHSFIRDPASKGWGYQIHNEPFLELMAERTWRVPIPGIGSDGGVRADVLPSLTGVVGNWRVYAQAGVQFRLGQDLEADFGAPRIRPGLSGSDAYIAARPVSWYVFVGVDGQAVAHDVSLDGNSFENSAHVTRQPFVGEVQAGLVVMALGARLSLTHVLQSPEFYHQKRGFFQFDSVALSVKF
jgi:lipid A 3-O-deacylase